MNNGVLTPATPQKLPKMAYLGPKINVLGPGGADLGRLGFLRLFLGPRGSSEYLYEILGVGAHWNPRQMVKKGKKMDIWI